MGSIFSSKPKPQEQIRVIRTLGLIRQLDDEKMKENREKVLKEKGDLKILYQQIQKIQNDSKNGQTFRPYHGGTYSGERKDEYRHGVGEFIMHSEKLEESIIEYYFGEWKDDKKCGKGAIFFQEGEYYVGEFLDGKSHGYGTFTLSDGSTYEGQWENDQQNGNGVEIMQDWRYKGEFKNGKRNGNGILIKENCYKLEGKFEDNDFVDGTVTYLASNAKEKYYKGKMKDGKFVGKGTITYQKDGKIFDGMQSRLKLGSFLDHKKEGEAHFQEDRTKQMYKGVWNDDRLTELQECH